MGSNDKSPFSLIAGKRALLQERAQYYVKTLLRWIDPLVWLSALRATLVIGINSRIGMRVPFTLLDRGKYRQHIAIGVEQQLTAYHLNRPRDGFRVISVGDFISIKAFHLSVRAFGVLIKAHPSARLTLIGDGPERPRLQALVASLGLQEFVNFVSWLPRAQALRRMGDADAFLFPSFEAAGMVVLEAMALGLPVICLRGGGASEMITSECGFVVDPSSLHATVEGLVAALTRLAGDPGLRRRMGATARRLVQEKYLWEERHHAIRQWYLAAGIVSTESRRVAPWHPLGDG